MVALKDYTNKDVNRFSKFYDQFFGSFNNFNFSDKCLIEFGFSALYKKYASLFEDESIKKTLPKKIKDLENKFNFSFDFSDEFRNFILKTNN